MECVRGRPRWLCTTRSLTGFAQVLRRTLVEGADSAGHIALRSVVAGIHVAKLARSIEKSYCSLVHLSG
jgi:hypothetical protein